MKFLPKKDSLIKLRNGTSIGYAIYGNKKKFPVFYFHGWPGSRLELRNIPLKKDVSAILKWEGILIDPIGALVAVLVFEFISAGEGHEFTQVALAEFGKIVLFGFTFGFTFLQISATFFTDVDSLTK